VTAKPRMGGCHQTLDGVLEGCSHEFVVRLYNIYMYLHIYSYVHLKSKVVVSHMSSVCCASLVVYREKD
jgi:hypothetical protein